MKLLLALTILAGLTAPVYAADPVCTTSTISEFSSAVLGTGWQLKSVDSAGINIFYVSFLAERPDYFYQSGADLTVIPDFILVGYNKGMVGLAFFKDGCMLGTALSDPVQLQHILTTAGASVSDGPSS